MTEQTPFNDYISLNDEMAGYFNTLPKTVQESIMQSNADIKSIGELKSVADTLLGRQ